MNQISSFRGPLAGSYPSAVLLVLCSLCPFLALSSALGAVEPDIQKEFSASAFEMQLTFGLATAAYCFGTVLSVQLTMLLPQRRVLVGFAVLLLLGSVIAAWAPSFGAFATGHVIQGLATALLLIAAAPALILGFPTRRLRYSAVVMNLGIFGAVALGPVIGGAFVDGWRELFWIVAAISGVAVLLSIFTFTDKAPGDPETPVDLLALGGSAAGSALAFFGASQLLNNSFLDPIVIVPIVAGVAMIVAVIVHQAQIGDPLMPLREAGQTLAVAGILVAMVAGAVSIGAVELVRMALDGASVSTTDAALLFWPEFGAALITAALFGTLFFTRWLPLYVFSGLVVLGVAVIVLFSAADGDQLPVAIGSGLLGLGVGAAVAPALFMAGFSMKSDRLPRIFAMIELLRGVAAFLVAPFLIHVAESAATTRAGVETGLWISLGITVAGILALAALWFGSGSKLRTPDTESWLNGDQPAVPPEPLFARLRG